MDRIHHYYIALGTATVLVIHIISLYITIIIIKLNVLVNYTSYIIVIDKPQ